MKKRPTTLPTALQAEYDEKERVDALMRFTRELALELEPTVEIRLNSP